MAPVFGFGRSGNWVLVFGLKSAFEVRTLLASWPGVPASRLLLKVLRETPPATPMRIGALMLLPNTVSGWQPAVVQKALPVSARFAAARLKSARKPVSLIRTWLMSIPRSRLLL